MSNKNLLILERSSSALVQGDTDKYILEGIFGELDVKNRNNRIYTAEEYVPQIEALQDKIKASKLLGELDHPSNFDVSLKNVSHIIEEITYDKDAKQIKGRIRLLDTDAGRQAKALVDAGVPLQISSRAAGAVESNGTVKIKQLFTYDLVADPGFANAELSRVNESYGFSNNSDILIYEMGESPRLTTENKTTENKTQSKMAESKFITAEDFNKYSKYLSEEIMNIKKSLTDAKEAGNETELSNLKEYTTYLAEKLDQNIQYTEHVAEKTDQSIQYAEVIAEKTNQSIQYAEYIAEKTDQAISYTESIAEKTDQSIQYTESIASGVNKIKEYTNYLAESYNEGASTHSDLLEYVDYLKENLEKVTEYAEYVAETVNTNLITEDSEETLEIKTNEKTDIKETTGNVGLAVNPTEKLEIVGESKEVKETKTTLDSLDAYKNGITEKLEALINKTKEAKTENPAFFKFVSESTQSDFNALETEDKTKVLSAIEGRGYLTEGQILGLWQNSLLTATKSTEPNVISMMPAEYKETFSKLSESKKNSIIAQSKMHKLETAYQVANFWQTRDLREVSQVMEKVELLKESVEVKSTIGYDTAGIAAELAKRFKK